MSRLRLVLLFVVSITSILAACGANPSPTAIPTSRPPVATTTAPLPTAVPASTVRCTYAGTGTTITLNNKRLTFTCPRQADNETGLLGVPASGAKGVEIDRAVYARDAGGFVLKSLSQVQVALVELADGSRCPFAGLGQAATLRGKRLNFTCGTQGSDTVGLIGDMASGDGGITIERTTLAKNAAGNLAITGAGITTVQVIALDVYVAQ